MRHIAPGATDQSVVIRIVDSADGTPEQAVEHNTAGVSLWYRREGAAITAITPASLAALTTAHTDGGIEHIDDGYYRLDLPDAAVAAGVAGVMVGGAFTDMVVIGCYIELETPQTGDAFARLGAPAGASVSADVATLTGRIPTALVSGRMASDAVAISGSTTAADALEANIANLDDSISSVVADVAAVQADTNDIQARLPASLVSGRMDASVGAVTTAAALAIWEALLVSMATAGSVGKKIADWVLGSDSKVVLSADAHPGAVIPTVTEITTGTPSNIKRNQALADYVFVMTAADTHAPAPGLSVTAVRSIDGGADAAGTLSAVTAHPANDGRYRVSFEAADLNGKVIILKATASGADDAFERIITVP